MSENKISSLSRIDQAIRGINEDSGDDSYIPAQSENGALERIQKSIENLDIKGIKTGLPKVTNADNGKVLQVKNGKWGKGDEKFKAVGNEDFKLNYITYAQTDTLYLVTGGISEHFERVSENLTENTPSTVIEGPVTLPPREIIMDHLAWQAFHDDDEYGGWSTVYSEESSGGASYLEYKFETPTMVEYIYCKFKYENLSDGDAQAIPIKIFVETSEDGITWTRHERPLIDHDISPSYKPSISTSRYAGTYKAIRFVSINPMYISNIACVSIGNIKFDGLVTNGDLNVRSIWYEGLCFGNVSEGGGSSGPTRTVLYQATDYEHAKIWSSDNWNNVSTWITLADGHTIDEFDEIQIVSLTSEGDQPGVHRYDNLVSYIVNAEDLVPQTGSTDNVKARIFWQSKQSGQQRDCDLSFSHDLTKVHPASMPAWYVIIYAIYGIKY